MAESKATLEQLAWERTVSPHVTSDIIWKLDAYRAALYVSHCVKRDLKAMNEVPSVVDQLTRASGAIASDLAEGYSRSTRTDRVRFYDYSLGSARECIVWYLGLEERLDPIVVSARLELISRCRALILGMIRSSRTNRPPKRAFES